MPAASAAAEYYIGAVGGLNFADMSLTDATGEDRLTSTRTLFGIGGIVGIELNDNLAVEMHPMYLRKGGTQMAIGENPNIDYTLSFIEIPILVKYSFGDRIRPHLFGGPSLGLLASAKAEGEVGGVVQGGAVRVYEADLTDVIGGFDLSLTIGAGFSYSLESFELFLDARYQYGLLELAEGGAITWESGDEVIEASLNEDAEIFTRGIQVMIGFTYPLGN
jgi:hypothetical protein